MKRFICFILMLAVLTISASAAEVVGTENGNHAYVPSVKNDDILVSVTRAADMSGAEYSYDLSYNCRCFDGDV